MSAIGLLGVVFSSVLLVVVGGYLFVAMLLALCIFAHWFLHLPLIYVPRMLATLSGWRNALYGGTPQSMQRSAGEALAAGAAAADDDDDDASSSELRKNE